MYDASLLQWIIGASRSEPHTSAVNSNFCACVRAYTWFIYCKSFTDLFQPPACAAKVIFSSGQHMLLKKAAERRWTENGEGTDVLQ